MNQLRVVVSSVVLSVVALGARAHADGRAWAAIQPHLPADVFVVGGANLGKVRTSKIYKTAIPALIAADQDHQQALAMIKAQCKIDVLDAIDDAVVAMSAEDKGVIVVALKGVDHAKFDTCLSAIAKQHDKTTITSAKVGDLTEYTASGETDKLYLAWLASDVLAMATEPKDKALLAGFVGGKGASAELSGAVAKAGTSDPVWCAMAKATPVPDVGTLKAGYGSIKLAGGKLAIGAHLVMSSAAEAGTLAQGAKVALADAVKKVPAALQKIAKSIAIATAGADVTITGSMPDTSTQDLVKLFDKMF